MFLDEGSVLRKKKKRKGLEAILIPDMFSAHSGEVTRGQESRAENEEGLGGFRRTDARSLDRMSLGF